MYRAPTDFSQVKTKTWSKNSDTSIFLNCFIFTQMILYVYVNRRDSFKNNLKYLDVVYCQVTKIESLNYLS